MTKFVVCAVRDRAMDGFGTPIFVQSLGVAIRSFSDEINRSESVMCQHPDDYDLYHIADYDDVTAAIDSFTPRQVAIGKQCVKPAISSS